MRLSIGDECLMGWRGAEETMRSSSWDVWRVVKRWEMRGVSPVDIRRTCCVSSRGVKFSRCFDY
jgi:hypothetical protein